MILGCCGHVDDCLDRRLLLVSAKLQEEPVYAALCFLMIAQIEVIQKLLDLESGVRHRPRVQLVRRVGCFQPGEGISDLAAQLAYRGAKLLDL